MSDEAEVVRQLQRILEQAVMRLYFTAPDLGRVVVDAWPDNHGKVDGRIVKLAPVPTQGVYGGGLWYEVEEES